MTGFLAVDPRPVVIPPFTGMTSVVTTFPTNVMAAFVFRPGGLA